MKGKIYNLKRYFYEKILSVFMVVVSMISCIFGMTCYASEYEKD